MIGSNRHLHASRSRARRAEQCAICSRRKPFKMKAPVKPWHGREGDLAPPVRSFAQPTPAATAPGSLRVAIGV
jgi:hypothetical protein